MRATSAPGWPAPWRCTAAARCLQGPSPTQARPASTPGPPQTARPACSGASVVAAAVGTASGSWPFALLEARLAAASLPRPPFALVPARCKGRWPLQQRRVATAAPAAASTQPGGCSACLTGSCSCFEVSERWCELSGGRDLAQPRSRPTVNGLKPRLQAAQQVANGCSYTS